MKIPIIVSAFGTTTKGIETYTAIDHKLKTALPGEEIIWSYSSRVIGKNLAQQKIKTEHPEEILASLAQKRYRGAILQPLLLFPGTEFHKLVHVAKESAVPCSVGMPLLTSPRDYHDLASLFTAAFTKKPTAALLILGHGTHHPTWTAYYSLEKILRQHYGSRLYVGVTEQYPNSDHLVEEIKADGFKEVILVPLFLIAGMHFQRDIVGQSATSWKSRLEDAGMKVESIDVGIGMLQGIERIITNHILDAKAQLPDNL